MTIQELFSLTTEENKDLSTIRVSGTIPTAVIEQHRDGVVQKLTETTPVDGFRPGSAPSNVVTQQVGDLEIWRRCGLAAIEQAFPDIVKVTGQTPISQPNLQFTALPVHGDISFSIDFFVMPAITLPDYQTTLSSVGKREDPDPVTDDDVTNVILDVRRGLYRNAHPEKSIPTDESLLPELTNEQITSISSMCKDMESFRTHIREGLAEEKKTEKKNKHRDAILKAIMDAVGDITIPDIVVEEGAKNSFEEFKAKAERLGTTVEKYCESENMKEEDLWKELRETSRERAKTQMVLNAIREQESITPDKETVDQELKRFKDRGGEGGDEEQARIYIESALANESVLQFLEGVAEN
ncbi:MAG: trigger factor [Candidatus Kaiserbacteria bacterium]|nr:trigger factor [Candidatus Kaiserbacteria bacterium]